MSTYFQPAESTPSVWFDPANGHVYNDPDGGELANDDYVGAMTGSTFKMSSRMPISLEVAVDHGIITEDDARARGWTPYVPPPIPWRRRLRSRLRGIWHNRPHVHLGPCDHSDCW